MGVSLAFPFGLFPNLYSQREHSFSWQSATSFEEKPEQSKHLFLIALSGVKFFIYFSPFLFSKLLIEVIPCEDMGFKGVERGFVGIIKNKNFRTVGMP